MSDYEVGYGKPPAGGQIKKGERRNPKGRPKKKAEPQATSDAEILTKLDGEPVEFQGKIITRREAELRVLQAQSLKGNAKATQQLEALRKRVNAERPVEEKRTGGVLLVPILSFDNWETEAAAQQAQFREKPFDGEEFKRRCASKE